MNTIIDIQNVSKIYKLYERPIDRMFEALSVTKKSRHSLYYALKDVTFSISRGEIVGFVGKNGAGKSTLLKIITGLLTENEGCVAVEGTISALLELGTGFNPEYSGVENIFLYGTMLGKTHEEIEKEVPGVIEFADIGEFINQPVKTYSSGMFARLAFSVAINVNPDILIVDEILAVGDLDFQLKCMSKMKEMMLGGTTVLFVSHDINSIRRFCTRAIWLKSGNLIEDGDVNSVTAHYLDDMRIESVDRQDDIVAQEVITKENENVSKSNKKLIAKVQLKEFNVLNSNREVIDKFYKDDKICIEIKYEVIDETLKNPVLGVAIRAMNDDYVCGLATSLDHVKIPWNKGLNIFELKYPNGLLLLGGQYYFDVAFFEETGTVSVDYTAKIKVIEVIDNYSAEGVFVIPHVWGDVDGR